MPKLTNLAAKIEYLQNHWNEVAFGWSDAHCVWHFQYGPRGAGSMMEHFGLTFWADDSDTFEEAVDEFLAHLRTLPDLPDEAAAQASAGL